MTYCENIFQAKSKIIQTYFGKFHVIYESGFKKGIIIESKGKMPHNFSEFLVHKIKFFLEKFSLIPFLKFFFMKLIRLCKII